MEKRPNILFLMCDQLQGKIFNSKTACKTPNIDKLITKSINFINAYTPNPVCSPARASLMTGLLPHNHGVLYVTHTVDKDRACLRTEHPHFAQNLQKAGYRTGYFGKWHVENSENPEKFGWDTSDKDTAKGIKSTDDLIKVRYNDYPEGYNSKHVLYGVTTNPPEKRGLGVTTDHASNFLDSVINKEGPWCCFVSIVEPHDPFICSKAYYDLYNIDDITLPENINDTFENKPNLYNLATRSWENMTIEERKEAIMCYYASVTEIDYLYGKLIDKLGDEINNTIIVLTSDHGEALGAHGVYCKNIGPYEEIYNIPMIMHIPNNAIGTISTAKIGLHDLCPTLLELTNCEPIDNTDSKSFASIFNNLSLEKDFNLGYAEYEGTRICFTQRVVWIDEWKYVFNGFDYDELYNLKFDPFEMNNLINDNTCKEQLVKMVGYLWKRIKETGDHSLYNTDYPILRVAPFGPTYKDFVN